MKSRSEPAIHPHDQRLIALALEEDLGRPPHDRTTETLFPARKGGKRRIRGVILCKSPPEVVVCGLRLAEGIFQQFDRRTRLESPYQDGEHIAAGDEIAVVTGPAAAILAGERTALNFLQRLSAIATLTYRFVEAVKGTKLRILDTRKTTPGLRRLEKYAVFCGGGVNHRMGLYDAILVKNNHVDLAGGMENALRNIPPEARRKAPVVVEVRNLAELQTVIEHGRGKVTRVLLDNMSVEDLVAAVKMCRGIFETEASGGLTLGNIRAVAETGVDYASIGHLTRAAADVDLALHVETKRR